MSSQMIISNTAIAVDTTGYRTGYQSDTRWLNFFSRDHALGAFYAHLETLKSARSPERHTQRSYESGLTHFLAWVGDELPTRDVLMAYIIHLQQPTARCPGGRAPRTIAAKYLAPVRLYLRMLEEQHIPNIQPGDFSYVGEVRRQLMIARRIENPAVDETEASALYAHGQRLTLAQINDLLSSLDTDTLPGKRDLALLYWGLTTGLRVSELARITLGKIRRGSTCAEIVVRGKRGRTDPVPVDETAINLLNDWVDAYNAKLNADDPRRITADTPVWQPLRRGGVPTPLGTRGFKPGRGIHRNQIRALVVNRSEEILGFAITTHDLRRTVAALARENGMDFDLIRVLLRHKSIATTARYVGNPRNLSASLISNHVRFNL